MIHSLKALSLALLLAVLGTSALAAASASAAQFHSEAEPTKVETTGGSLHTFTFKSEMGASVEMKCFTSTHSSTQATKTAESITAGPFYQLPCSVAGVTATINSNGCKFRLFANNTMNVECPTSAGYMVGGGGCAVTILPQTGKSTVTYVNNGKGIDVTFAAGLTYTSSGFFCAGCGTGTYKGTSTLIGRNSGGTQVKYWYE